MRFISLILCSIILVQCGTSKKIVSHQEEAPGSSNYRIAFYNCENLFDIYDDPLIADEEFTPLGKNKWDLERYTKKLRNINRVIREMGYPMLVGLSEIENAQTLYDLTASGQHTYRYVHYDSPDFRGIDVALLYDPTVIKIIDSKPVKVELPEYLSEYKTTRDVLVVTCSVLPTQDTLHLLVNHWPSRRGGYAVSDPKRILLGNIVRLQIDSIFSQNTAASIVVMGDFNDEPGNASIYNALKAKDNIPTQTSTDLFNPWYSKSKNGEGSHSFDSKWSALDQIMISGALISGNKGIQYSGAFIFKKDFLLYPDPKYGLCPLRTYSGPAYLGGFSDHLPVYIELKPIRFRS